MLVYNSWHGSYASQLTDICVTGFEKTTLLERSGSGGQFHTVNVVR